ncbi:MAG: Crp/Fnr family transcriptional regulator [Bacteroidia bacterium]
MIACFKNYFLGKARFSEDELNSITAATHVLYLKKGEHLYNEGSIWPYDGIVCKGLLYKHTTHISGNTAVTGFASENYWVGDRSSSLTGKAIAYTCTALEDTTIACLEIEALEQLRIQIPALNELCDNLMQKYMASMQKRISDNMILSDEERYAQFLDTRTGLNLRVPNILIASYLNIRPENMDAICNGIPWPQQKMRTT